MKIETEKKLLRAICIIARKHEVNLGSKLKSEERFQEHPRDEDLEEEAVKALNYLVDYWDR